MEDSEGECIFKYIKGKRITPSTVDRMRADGCALFDNKGFVFTDACKVYRTVKRLKVPAQYTYTFAPCDDDALYLETYRLPRLPTNDDAPYYIEEIYVESGAKVFYRPDLGSYVDNTVLLPCNVQYLVLSDVRIDNMFEHDTCRMVPIISVLYIHPGITCEQVNEAKEVVNTSQHLSSHNSSSTHRRYKSVVSSPP